MIYDIIAYSKPTDVPQNVGDVIKRVRVDSNEGEEIELVSLINNFFSDVDYESLAIPEPAITLLGSLSKVTTNEEVNDVLGTLRFYGVHFAIIALPSLSAESIDDPDLQCISYLMLPKAYKSGTYSVPVMYEGASIGFKTVPTIGLMLLELLKVLPIPNTFGKFTTVKNIIEFYSTIGSDDASLIRITDMLKAIESLGYEYLGVIL